MKYYICGKITGNPDYKKQFETVADDYRKLGHEVCNPASNGPAFDIKHEGVVWQYFMRRSLREMLSCDALVVQSNYETSEGALFEIEVATKIGMPVAYL